MPAIDMLSLVSDALQDIASLHQNACHHWQRDRLHSRENLSSDTRALDFPERRFGHLSAVVGPCQLNDNGPLSVQTAVTHEWSVANVDAILATVERLYAMATDDRLGAAVFLDRMPWLPALVDEIAADGARLDG
jgi:hypothetical protein